MKFLRPLALTALACGLGASSAVAAPPTPIPGGSNQVSALSGATGQTLFNASSGSRSTRSATRPRPTTPRRRCPAQTSASW